MEGVRSAIREGGGWFRWLVQQERHNEKDVLIAPRLNFHAWRGGLGGQQVRMYILPLVGNCIRLAICSDIFVFEVEEGVTFLVILLRRIGITVVQLEEELESYCTLM